mgnify:CR=1 FL=1
MNRLSNEHDDALIRLMDDDTPVVQEALIKEFKRMDEKGIHLLQKLTHNNNRILSSHAREFLQEISGHDTVADFYRFIRSLNYELETGSLLLDRTVFPNVDVAECCIQIDVIAARCREIMILPSTPWEKCKVLNRVIFHEFGFRGNSENFDDPLNSLISQVLIRRKGIPITLSILYILVAQRCGINLEPIGMPVRFLVGCFLEEAPFYIDPYERGRFKMEEDLNDFLCNENFSPKPSYFSPIPVGQILRRSCANLSRQYTLNNDPERARLFASFVREFETIYRRHAKS